MQQQPKLSYVNASLSDVKVERIETTPNGKKKEIWLNVGDQVVAKTTERFWRAFNMKYETTDNIFNHFSHKEVLERIGQSPLGKERIRLCVEHDDVFNKDALLGLAGVDKPQITFEDTLSLAERHHGENLRYKNGVVSIDFSPKSGESAFTIGSDEFKNRFLMEVPVDGFTKPRFTLSLLRLVCANGAVGYAPFFRSDVNMGAKNAVYTLSKAVEGYDNEKGYDILVKRMTSAQQSWASIFECQALHDVLIKAGVLNDQMAIFRKMTGNVCDLYQIANVDYVTPKKQRQLPSKARVYDVINFATEVATHHLDPERARRVNGHIGELLVSDYDLEGTAAQITDFKDLFLKTA